MARQGHKRRAGTCQMKGTKHPNRRNSRCLCLEPLRSSELKKKSSVFWCMLVGERRVTLLLSTNFLCSLSVGFVREVEGGAGHVDANITAYRFSSAVWKVQRSQLSSHTGNLFCPAKSQLTESPTSDTSFQSLELTETKTAGQSLPGDSHLQHREGSGGKISIENRISESFSLRGNLSFFFRCV